ncbi:MAG: acetyl-CoA carboxylase biotin carboxyl carrier protein subunit [Pelobium sp.]
MYKIKVNGKHEFDTEFKEGTVKLNGVIEEIDKVDLGNNHFHILHQHKSYNAELIAFDKAAKKIKIKINANIYELDIKDQYDLLLKNLGLENLNASKLKEIKAPMPGLVLKILVKEGDEVKKGDSLLVLEAMKMENMIKAPADIHIKKINIKPGDKVEKNQSLINLN